MAEEQLAAHETKLEEYLAIKKTGLARQGAALALEMGIAHEREFVKFWRKMSQDA
jgi:hypothetical protein